MKHSKIAGAILVGILSTQAPARPVIPLPTTYDKLEDSKVNGATVKVGPLTFSNFGDWSSDPANEVKDTDVMVRENNSATEPGLIFQFSLTATGNMDIAETKSVTWKYQVDTPGGFTDATLTFTGMSDKAGGAIPSVQKTLTFGTETKMLNATVDNNDTPTTDMILLDGSPTSLMVMEVGTCTTAKTGVVRSSSISSVTDGFSVPEPNALLAVAFFGMFFGARRSVR